MENKINPIEGQLTIIDAEGNEKLCQILFTLESEEFGKNYVVFYPIESIEDDESEQIQLMAASFKENEDGTGELSEVETNEEWALLESAVAQYEEQMEEEDECCCHGHGHCGEGEECCEGHGHCDEEKKEGCEGHHCCCHHDE